MSTVELYTAAARGFVDLVGRLPPTGWDGPGLGEWDLRALVGHTSRSLITVLDYLPKSAAQQDVSDAAHYYALIREQARGPGVAERGRQAGSALGDDPAAAVAALAERVFAALDGQPDRLITVIGGLGIGLYDYLDTRIVELAVHCGDIAAATGVPSGMPADVLERAVTIIAQVAARGDDGETLLRALTGRTTLPAGFSAV